nr:hypothetical protein [Mucilaginibacter sp. FT3.2]
MRFPSREGTNISIYTIFGDVFKHQHVMAIENVTVYNLSLELREVNTKLKDICKKYQIEYGDLFCSFDGFYLIGIDISGVLNNSNSPLRESLIDFQEPRTEKSA